MRARSERTARPAAWAGNQKWGKQNAGAAAVDWTASWQVFEIHAKQRGYCGSGTKKGTSVRDHNVQCLSLQNYPMDD